MMGSYPTELPGGIKHYSEVVVTHPELDTDTPSLNP